MACGCDVYLGLTFDANFNHTELQNVDAHNRTTSIGEIKQYSAS